KPCVTRTGIAQKPRKCWVFTADCSTRKSRNTASKGTRRRAERPDVRAPAHIASFLRNRFRRRNALRSAIRRRDASDARREAQGHGESDPRGRSVPAVRVADSREE